MISTDQEESLEREILCKLEASVDRKRLAALGIPPRALPPLTRGFPKLIRGTFSEHFKDLAALKTHWIDRALLHLYRNFKPKAGVKVVIFTWVIGDGFGDYYAQIEASRILSSILPKESLTLITLLPKESSLPVGTQYVVRYAHRSNQWREIVPDPFTPEIEEALRSADFILQIPTYYPNTPSVLPRGPQYALVGEGGWLDTPHFHPLSGARCMGLHYLEKGIFIKEMPPSGQAPRLLNQRVKEILFGTGVPSPQHISNYLEKSRFNCAYTYTDSGLYLYLHILLKSLEEEAKTCDVALFDLNPLFNAIEGLYLPLFEATGIKEVHILFQNHITTLNIAKRGKTLRFIHVDVLDHSECLAMIAFSQDLVGCRGDGSLSEAVSANKPFFLDPPKHKRELIEDLTALAATHLPETPELTEYLKLHLENPSLLSADGSVFTPLFLRDIGDRMGTLLKNPHVSLGFSKLNHILQSNYAVNPLLQNLTLRALTHKAYPHIEVLEKNLLDAFFQEKKPFHEVCAELQNALSALD